MSIPTTFLQSLTRAMEARAPLFALREVVKAELESGTARETVTTWLEKGRVRLPEKEDLLQEVLDLLVGWCSPQVKL